ncbi:MAG: tRNA (N6-threonylcarbamoyladenosine(37)-N6)-methyltransferase TrmO [Methanophagales archaeon]|nr:tRNA (N6-threonylcarbamoyladenosine(37)-N6)-methyltransferase TrmO [Methanophagales archaeon]PXF51074.1 MAG: tRNA (N6-threonylcarbamoyladenosine(37)-N6)-methyltransferase TrmO [Methanophagales archaeon]HDN68141.1 tRNA (N6-threonylcarbamoyladenosine(37)-N6)-methyltransferase TrmO [Methanomicrobia archaeon]
MLEKVTYKPIGIIHTGFRDKRNAPIQGVFAKDAKGVVEVFPEYAEGLKDIKGFSHLILLYHFHLADADTESYSLTSKPFLEDEEHGIFSIRHFKRPNPIGLSVVRLESVRGNRLEIREVDILDGTPLLDLKPFVPRFDNRLEAKTGWLANPNLDWAKGESGKHRSE